MIDHCTRPGFITGLSSNQGTGLVLHHQLAHKHVRCNIWWMVAAPCKSHAWTQSKLCQSYVNREICGEVGAFFHCVCKSSGWRYWWVVSGGSSNYVRIPSDYPTLPHTSHTSYLTRRSTTNIAFINTFLQTPFLPQYIEQQQDYKDRQATPEC